MGKGMSTDFNIVLRNGRILDGCGNPWFYGDLGIRDGRVAAIAPPGTLQGTRVIEVDGRYVAPGFIDIHTHSDLTILINRRAESMVRQGATTNVIGNCGMGPAPVSDEHLDELRQDWGNFARQAAVTWEWRTFGEFLDVVEKDGIAINIAALVGHGALRCAAMGFANRPPTPAELETMKAHTAEAMESGAFGMSTGLVYPPGCFANTDEIVALCKVVARYNGIYTSHIRGERETILEAVAEAIHIGSEAGVPVEVSHNAPKYGAPCDAHENLALIAAARAQGQDVTVDNDVHMDLGVTLPWSLPQHLEAEGIEKIVAVLRDPEARREIQQELLEDARPGFGPRGLIRHERWDRIVIMTAPKDPGIVGKTLEMLAKERGQDNPFDTYFDLIVEHGVDIEANFDYIEEKNIKILLQNPLMMICSDGAVMAPYGPLSDPPSYGPCSYGEFPGVLERYVRDEPVMTLQEAIRKMTSYPAQRLGLFDRGVLRPGAWADVVVFDMERLHDRATNLFPHTYPFENFPHDYPEGIDYVLVNGTVVVDEAEHTGALPGKLLRHPSGRAQ
jgi:N-acyl-D-amino-acid deacylase